MAQLSAEDRHRLTAAIHKRGDIRAKLALQWVQNLSRVANELRSNGKSTSVDTQTVFWIRLHGVIVDVGEHYEEACKLLFDDQGQATSVIAKQVAAVRDAIRSVCSALDDDERLWVHYRRDTECHVWQESYELGLKASGKLKDERYFALLGRTMHVDEIDKRARALVRKYNVDEPAMAVDFATRLAALVTKILDAMKPLYAS